MRIPKKTLYAYRSLIIFIGLLIFLSLLPLPSYVIRILTLMCIFSCLTISWSLPARADLISIGHAAFFGVGAYTSALIFLNFRLSPLIGMWIGAALAVVIALLVGYPCFKFGVKGLYFAIATLVMAEGIRLLFITFEDVTGGMNGLSITFLGNNPLYLQFSDLRLYCIVACILLLFSSVIFYEIHNGKLGLFLSAIAENEVAAASLGVNTLKVKLVIFMVSALLCALTGAIYAQFAGYISPATVLSLDLSVLIILYSIIGGIYSFWGPIFGAFLMVPISEILRVFLGAYGRDLAWVVYGSLIIFFMLTKPEGIIRARKGE